MRFVSENVAVGLSLRQVRYKHAQTHRTSTCPRIVTVTAHVIDPMTSEASSPVLGVVSGARTHVFTCQGFEYHW